MSFLVRKTKFLNYNEIQRAMWELKSLPSYFVDNNIGTVIKTYLIVWNHVKNRLSFTFPSHYLGIFSQSAALIFNTYILIVTSIVLFFQIK